MPLDVVQSTWHYFLALHHEAVLQIHRKTLHAGIQIYLQPILISHVTAISHHEGTSATTFILSDCLYEFENCDGQQNLAADIILEAQTIFWGLGGWSWFCHLQ
jgi:hypothetical protein